MSRVAGAVLVVHRLEFPLPVSYLCYAVWGACLARGDIEIFAEPLVYVTVLVNLLLMVGGLALNVAVDFETDRRHAGKDYLAGATLRLGRTRVLQLSIAETTVALVLAGLVAVWANHWPVVVFAGITALLHQLYNIDPFRLKRKVAGPFVFGAAMVPLPCLLAYSAFRADFAPALWPFLLGVCSLSVGRTIWWSVPDHAVDTATGFTTPAVRFGSAGALRMASLTVLVGTALLGWSLWWLYGPVWAAVGMAAHVIFLLRMTSSVYPRHMLKHTMPIVMLGDIALVVIPLIA
ncbi:4-hydroxybenzoate polyprenyltransferase [Amycolatopsis xylanica]|uniref:4-hydroxybenzoate polyprenyltransferase n=1 Tax=Amycolatopsis xylanica TaxID=589385 RepID=A0A1H2ZK39_9PSEU|nr:UbiA family prenyltransferase [Amycolatopsis xylanica]SDX17745.1 4-hydroxybenzoate polyprenyltransferase [Amycolatopsis xylanica]